MHFFHADRSRPPGEHALDDDERIEVGVLHALSAAWRLVAAGEIADAKTVLALFWLRGGEKVRRYSWR